MKYNIMISLSILLPLFLSQLSFAQNRIELIDGSVISGEVLSLDKGIYTIKSSIGQLKIDKSQVKVIRLKVPTSPPDTKKGIQALQEYMMEDEVIFDKISALQTDPEIQGILEDPVIMKAIQAADTNALLANPKFMKLLDNQNILSLVEETNPYK